MNLPNKITLTRICLIPVFAVVFLVEAIPYRGLIACGIFVLAACTDFLDGHIARARGLVTDLGKFLDPIADKVLVSTALILLLCRPSAWDFLELGGWLPAALGVCVALILAREQIVSGLRMVAAAKGVVLAADLSGKIKTTVQDIAVAALLAAADLYALHGLTGTVVCAVGLIGIALATVLTVWSGVVYLVKNRNVLKEKSEE